MRVTVTFHMPDADLEEGWPDRNEFQETVKATLHELNGDDGGVYVPQNVWVEVTEA